MEAPSGTNSERTIQIGPDRVTILGSEIVIEAKHDMPDWELRDLNPIPVYFEDRKYHLVEKRKAAAPYAVRYLLQPWPEGHVSNAKLFWTYDAEAVAERDANLRSGKVDDAVRIALLPFYPILGLLWSGTQQRLMRFGFVPHAITGASIFSGFCLAFADGVFAVITLQSTARTGKMMAGGLIRAMASSDHLQIGPVAIPFLFLDLVLFVALVADVAMRWTLYMREDQWSGGFRQWLVPRWLRKK